MNFEAKMKKRGMKRLDATVPQLYKKPRREFPFWAKIAIPTSAFAATAVVVFVLVLNSLNGIKDTRFFATAPKAKVVKSVDSSLVNRTAAKTLESLDSYFADPNNQNYVLSPASYLLAASAVAAVSDGFDLEAFGLVDAGQDTKTLLESWNFKYKKDNQYEAAHCQFDSGVLHQQVGEKYRFDDKKREAIASDYIATSVASKDDYLDQATNYFKKHVGLDIPIPDPHITDGVITYGALSMKDYVPNGLSTDKKDFHVDGKTIQVDAHPFGSIEYPLSLPYYAGSTYQVLEMRIYATSLLFVLPDEGVSLESISVSEAYSSFMAHKQYQDTMGYVPYFHLQTLSENLTGAMLDKLTGNEIFFSKLLTDDVMNDLSLQSVLQTSDFEFNRYGVSGKSITVMTYAGAVAPHPHEVVVFNVDRPFYAISLKDGFPLFVNKVNDPSK